VSENDKLGVKAAPRVLPMWKWFFTKGGIPTLVAILALIASVIFNIILLQSKQELRDFRPVGGFESGNLMDEVLQQCKRHLSDDPVPPLHIVADFATYGDFSFPEKFKEYIDTLRKRSDNGKNSVSYIVLSEQGQRDALRLEFENYADRVKAPAFLVKAQNYLALEYSRGALKKLGLEAKALRPETLTADDFVNVNIEADKLLVADMQNWGIKVKSYPYNLTVHAWSGARDDTLIAIVDFKGGIDEVGFLARRQVAEDISRIFDIIETDSISVP
jgi:hypothetical protein